MRSDDFGPLLDDKLPDKYELVSTPITEDDFGPLAECLAAAYGIQHDIWDSARIPVVFLLNKDVQKTFRLLHTSEDGKTTVAGTATLKLMPEYPGCGHVHWVAVHPQHQGNGFAKILVKAILRETRDAHGLSSSVLHVVDSSIPAINTYEQFGFKPVMIEENNPARWAAIRAAQAANSLQRPTGVCT